MQRAVACLAIAIYALGQWAALVHRAEVRHTRCAEHGELVEVRAIDVDASSYHGLSTLVARNDARTIDSDEHCPFATASRATLHAAQHATTASALPCLAVTAPPLAAAHPPQLSLLSVAPKTSPPVTSSVVSSQPGFFTHSDEVLVCVRPSYYSRFSRSPAAPPWCTATSARCSIRHPVA